MSMFGSFLPSLGRKATTVYSGRGSRHCYEIMWILADFTCSVSALNGGTLIAFSSETASDRRYSPQLLPMIRTSDWRVETSVRPIAPHGLRRASVYPRDLPPREGSEENPLADPRPKAKCDIWRRIRRGVWSCRCRHRLASKRADQRPVQWERADRVGVSPWDRQL